MRSFDFKPTSPSPLFPGQFPSQHNYRPAFAALVIGVEWMRVPIRLFLLLQTLLSVFVFRNGGSNTNDGSPLSVSVTAARHSVLHFYHFYHIHLHLLAIIRSLSSTLYFSLDIAQSWVGHGSLPDSERVWSQANNQPTPIWESRQRLHGYRRVRVWLQQLRGGRLLWQFLNVMLFFVSTSFCVIGLVVVWCRDSLLSSLCRLGLQGQFVFQPTFQLVILSWLQESKVDKITTFYTWCYDGLADTPSRTNRLLFTLMTVLHSTTEYAHAMIVRTFRIRHFYGIVGV